MSVLNTSPDNNDLADSASGLPRHVALIMDGNGRWAKSRGKARIEGHRAGGATVRMVVEESRRLGLRAVTLYAFSTENWGRPSKEVGALMGLFERMLQSELKLMQENGIRLRVIGQRERLGPAVRKAIERCEEATATLDGMDLVLAVSYGGREEIVHAARQLASKVAAGELESSEIDTDLFRKQLYAPDLPDPDLLIRTSGEMRISNFLLWQIAYAEIVVSPVCWPDFSREEYLRCLEEFRKRERRFGLA